MGFPLLSHGSVFFLKHFHFTHKKWFEKEKLFCIGQWIILWFLYKLKRTSSRFGTLDSSLLRRKHLAGVYLLSSKKHFWDLTIVADHLSSSLDETLVFCNGLKKSISNLFGFLHKYEASSGQRINKSKSARFLSRKTTAARKIVMQNTSGISCKRMKNHLPGCSFVLWKVKKIKTFITRKLEIEGWVGR